MPLNTPALAQSIEKLLTEQAARKTDPARARQFFAQQLAAAIATHLLSATVTTTGTAAAQTGLLS